MVNVESKSREIFGNPEQELMDSSFLYLNVEKEARCLSTVAKIHSQE